jgi:hypothetical protein
MAQNVFGGTRQIALGEYYGVDRDVPCSGIIKMSDLHGTSRLPAASTSVTGLTTPNNPSGGYLQRISTAGGFAGDFPLQIIPQLEVKTAGGSGTGPMIDGTQTIYVTMYGYLAYGFMLWYTTSNNINTAVNPAVSPNGVASNDYYRHPTTCGSWNFVTRISENTHSIYGGSSGRGTVTASNMAYVLNVLVGAKIQFAYSCGPSWQNEMSNGSITVRFDNTRSDPCGTAGVTPGGAFHSQIT